MERLIRRRLRNQKLLQSDLREPAQVVAWLGAVQSQDFGGAKWGLGQRASGLTDETIERAFNAGDILRTHILRPTWHFVTPADISWILTLTAPRVQRFNANYYRQFELDPRTLSRARAVLARALDGGAYLIRAELAAALGRARIVASGPRLGLITMDAELNQVMCSGPLRGRQFTYARFESRVPKPRTLTREAALAELTRRYFQSHGPATLKDFAWWSGLTMRDVKEGVELVKPALVCEAVDGLEYRMMASDAPVRRRGAFAWLLPTYDEYLIAYRDRGMVVRTSRSVFADAFTNHLIVDGLLVGSWKPVAIKTEVRVDVEFYDRALPSCEPALQKAVALYAKFLGKPAGLRSRT